MTSQESAKSILHAQKRKGGRTSSPPLHYAHARSVFNCIVSVQVDHSSSEQGLATQSSTADHTSSESWTAAAVSKRRVRAGPVRRRYSCRYTVHCLAPTRPTKYRNLRATRDTSLAPANCVVATELGCGYQEACPSLQPQPSCCLP